MKFTLFEAEQSPEVVELFTRVFSNSEGEEEGRLIGSLVSDLITTTATDDLVGCTAISGEEVVGSIFFSRFVLSSNRVAFILSPVAVATARQGEGLGQQLINFGLAQLKASGVELVFTYGDPNFYQKVGFQQISEDSVKAPLKLTYPEGWMAQSLTGGTMEIGGDSGRCVVALDDQRYW